MKAKSKRIVSLFLMCIMFITIFPMQVFAKEFKYLPVQDISQEVKDSGMFYIASPASSVEENSLDVHLFKVERGGENLPKTSVVLNIMDITSKYGDDYKIKIHDNELFGEKVQGEDDSKSVLEEITENKEDIEEVNDSDAIVSEDGVTKEEAENLYQQDLNDLETALNTNKQEEANENNASQEISEKEKQENTQENVQENKENKTEEQEGTEKQQNQDEEAVIDGTPLTPEAAKEMATGLESDKTPMDGGDNVSEELEKMLSSLSIDLNSAYLKLDFEEGETEKIIEIIPKDNIVGDGDRMFQMFLVAGDKNATISDHSGLTVTIVDNEEQQPAVVSFDSAEFYPQDGYIKAKVVRKGAINQVVTVKVSTQEVTAVSQQDFSPVDTTLTFPYGITERTINIPIRSDFIKDTASFKISLSEAVGCEIGEISQASGIISSNDVSMLMEESKVETASARAEATVNSIFFGPEIDLSKAYGVGAENDGYSKMEGKDYVLYSEDAWDDGVESWANWEFGSHYDYSGFQIDWTQTSGKPCYSETLVKYYNYDEKNFKPVWITDDERWNRKQTNIFIPTDKLREIFIDLIRDGGWLGRSPKLNIHAIKPILRPFEVSLAGADPLYFLNEKGQYVKNTQIGELENANQTILQGATNTGTGTTVKFSGEEITVTSNSPYSYIKGLKIVHPTTGRSKIIQNNLDVGKNSTSFYLTNEFIQDNLSYIAFVNNGSNGKKGQFKVQAIMGYYDTSISINEDNRANVEMINKPKNPPPSFETEYNGVYKIKAVHSNKYLLNASDKSKGNVTQGKDTNTNKSKWEIKSIPGTDYVTIKNMSGYYLDVSGASSSNGANIQTYNGNNTDAQKFKLEKQSDGSYAILTKVSGEMRGLDVDGRSTADGANVSQYQYLGQNNQKWKLELQKQNESIPKKVQIHKGDTIVLKQNVYDEYNEYYTSSSITMSTYKHSNANKITVDRFYDDINNNTCTFLNEFSEIAITPNVIKRDNHTVIRIPTDSISKFDTTKGFFALNPSKSIVGEYTQYVVVTREDWKKQYYEFTAITKNKTYVPIWKTIYSDTKYSQNTFYYEMRDEKDDNVIYLDAEKADDKKYSLSASSFYADVGLDHISQGKAWIPASGVYTLMGNTVYGISNELGKIDTIPANGISGYSVIYKTVGSGRTTYKTTKLNQNKTKEYTIYDNDGNVSGTQTVYDVDLGNITVSSIDTTVPYPSGVYATNNDDVNSGVIFINDDITKLKTAIKNNNSEYVDSDGEKHSEKVIAVDYIVYDSLTNKQKSVIKGSVESVDDNGDSIWTISPTFKKGEAAQYSASDRLYVQITTDRYIGNGKSEDENGNLQPNPALRQTTYAPIYTGYTFVESNRVDPVTQEITIPSDMDFIKLPLIGTMNATFNIKMISLSVSELPNGGKRLSVGYIPKTKPKPADNGVNYGVKDIKEAWQGIKDFGEEIDKKLKESNDLATIGMDSWGIRPMFGLYLDFAIQNVDYTEHVSKQLAFIGGGLYIGLTGNFRIVQYFVIGYVPCYFGTNGELNVFTNVGIKSEIEGHVSPDTIKNEENSFDDTFEPEFCLQANGLIAAYAGVGLCGTLGVRGGIQFGANYIYNPTIKNLYPDYRENGLILNVSIKVWVDALIFSIPVPVVGVEDRYGYYEDVKVDQDEETTKSVSNIQNIAETNIFEKPRNSSNSKWIGSENSMIKPYSSFEQDGESYTLVENSYDRADAQLLDMGNGKTLMVFVSDIGDSRSSENRTAIQYSVYENGKWSKPVTIQKDDTADFDPNIVDAGDKVLVTWTSKNTSKSSKTNSDYLRSMEVYATTIDKNTLKVGTIEQLSNDNFYDSAPVGLYDDETGDMLVYYLKSEVTEDFENSVTPQKNESVIVYMLYDASKGKWARDYYYDNEIADPADEPILVEKWGGQRFLSSPLKGFGQNGEDVNDPIIVDFNAISYNGIGMYAYTVDQDNNMDTNSDRELFIQCYDFKQHKTYVPVRVTNDNLSDSNPQLVRKGDNTYLFWLQNEKDIRYIDVTNLIKNGVDSNGAIKPDYELNPSVVFFTNELGQDINPTFGSYKAYVDSDNNLYIVWLQPVKDEEGNSYQEVFASALVRTDESQASSWSSGVQLTNSGKFNDEVALVTDSAGNLMIVNNQYDMDLTSQEIGVQNSKLVATKFKTVGSVETAEVKYSNDTPQAGSETEVSIKIKNDGLKPASGHTIKVYEVLNGKKGKTPIYENTSNDIITPSSSKFETFNWKMPDNYDKVESLSLYITVQEEGMKEISEFTSESINIKPVYKLDNCNIEERLDGFYASYTVTNIGNVDHKLDDENIDYVVTEFNDIYHTGKQYDPFMKTPIGDLKIGESETFVLPLNIPEELFKYGYTSAYMEVQDNKGERIAGSQSFDIELKHPYNIVINNDSSLEVINLKQGENINLSATYSPNEFYSNGTISFDTIDNQVARIDENGNLVAVADGTTELVASVIPYGGEKTVKVIVGSGESNKPTDPDNPDNPNNPNNPDNTDNSQEKPDGGKSPSTGDMSNLVLWFMILILSAGTVIIVYVFKKKQKR